MTVAKEIEFSDRYINLGAMLTRQVSNRTNEVAGDGTTTAAVLTRAIFSEGCKSVAAGVNAMGIRRGISQAVEEVVGELKKLTTPVGDHESI